MSLPALLRSDALARHPEAATWSCLRLVWAFLADPSLQAVLLVRLVLASPGRLLFLWRIVTIARFRMEIFRAEVGPGLHLPHPFGIIFARGTRLGRGVTVHQGVSIGWPRISKTAPLPSPSVGDGTVIGAGAVLIGDITIGAQSWLGPRVFVDRDVLPGSVVEQSWDA